MSYIHKKKNKNIKKFKKLQKLHLLMCFQTFYFWCWFQKVLNLLTNKCNSRYQDTRIHKKHRHQANRSYRSSIQYTVHSVTAMSKISRVSGPRTETASAQSLFGCSCAEFSEMSNNVAETWCSPEDYTYKSCPAMKIKAPLHSLVLLLMPGEV